MGLSDRKTFHFLQLIVYGMLVMIFGGVFPCAIFVCVQPILRRRSLFSSAAAGYGPLQEVSVRRIWPQT